MPNRRIAETVNYNVPIHGRKMTPAGLVDYLAHGLDQKIVVGVDPNVIKKWGPDGELRTIGESPAQAYYEHENDFLQAPMAAAKFAHQYGVLFSPNQTPRLGELYKAMDLLTPHATKRTLGNTHIDAIVELLGEKAALKLSRGNNEKIKLEARAVEHDDPLGSKKYEWSRVTDNFGEQYYVDFAFELPPHFDRKGFVAEKGTAVVDLFRTKYVSLQDFNGIADAVEIPRDFSLSFVGDANKLLLHLQILKERRWNPKANTRDKIFERYKRVITDVMEQIQDKTDFQITDSSVLKNGDDDDQEHGFLPPKEFDHGSWSPPGADDDDDDEDW